MNAARGQESGRQDFATDFDFSRNQFFGERSVIIQPHSLGADLDEGRAGAPFHAVAGRLVWSAVAAVLHVLPRAQLCKPN